MRVWLPEHFADDLARSLAPFSGREARQNALRRFKYRQLLRIGARDLLGDAELSVTTEELSRLADACLGAAWSDAESDARARFGAPRDAAGLATGLEDRGHALGSPDTPASQGHRARLERP